MQRATQHLSGAEAEALHYPVCCLLLETRHKEVDDLMEDKYILLREWYNENVRYANEDEFTTLKKNFERFDENQ